MARAALYLSSFKLPELYSLQDSLLTSIWLRREQFRIFETMINVLSAGLTLDSKVSTKIEDLMQDYINLVIPGSTKDKKERDAAFAAKTAQALNDVAALLAASPGSKIAINKKG